MFVIALAALLLPGYALARALRVPYALAAAFPLSALLIAETIVAFSCLEVPIRLGTVLVAPAAVMIAGLAFDRHGRVKSSTDAREVFIPAPPRGLPTIVAILVGLTLFALAVTAALFPLTGFDTVFRWEALS